MIYESNVLNPKHNEKEKKNLNINRKHKNKQNIKNGRKFDLMEN
jgi:hypothetical protein